MNLDQLNKAFNANKHRTGDLIKFEPEIKVRRETDTLYISQLRKTKINLMATVEVHDGKRSDKAPMPLASLNETALKAIYIRLTA